MATLVDSSALYALLDADDAHHARARSAFEHFQDAETLITHNYVVLETTALVQRRFGTWATRELHEDLLPPLTTVWVDEDLHRAGLTALLAGARRDISLVDWVSFELMRKRGIERAFAFDRDFAAQGFSTVP